MKQHLSRTDIYEVSVCTASPGKKHQKSRSCGASLYKGLLLMLLPAAVFLILSLAGYRPIQDMAGPVGTIPGEHHLDHHVLYIAHVNNTHAHLDPITRKHILDGQTMTLNVGGYPRLHIQIEPWREAAAEEQAGFLFLHAGDMFQGSGYFMLFHGEPEARMWNRMEPEADRLSSCN